jgi:hypothetical protein
MSTVVRKASPLSKLVWLTLVVFTFGLWWLVRGAPKS